MRFLPSDLQVFQSINKVKGGHYSSPSSKNFESIDALRLGGGTCDDKFFQMTVSSKHSIKVRNSRCLYLIHKT